MTHIKTLALAALITLFGVKSKIYSQTYAKNGMVVSTNEIASKVGINILKNGGNAIDASIATGFALAVVHPSAGNIGGGGFLVYMDSKGNATTIDFREKAPLKASSEMFLNSEGELLKSKNKAGGLSTVNHVGLNSVGVPGTVAGLYLAHQKYGSLPWKDLVQPAIDLAEDGITMTWNLARDARFFNENSDINFLKNYFSDEEGKVHEFGELWTQPELANTLKIIRDQGKDGFYKGKVAKEIARFMQDNGGIISLEDLNRYKAIERNPIIGKYKDYTIFSMPPASSGGVALIEMLNMTENAEMSKMEFNSTEYVHLVAEIMRRAYADRAEYLGDIDFNPDTPLNKLISKRFAKRRFENIDLKKASKSDSTRFGQMYDGEHTTHFSVVDSKGNAVSLTYTLEQGYGSGMGSENLGFLFNNEMGDFNPKPGFTNTKGLIGTNPNLIEPEKRMLSSMTPTIVAKNGKPYLVIGSPGGRTIINTVFQTILNVLEFNMPIDKAIESMKIHHQWLPDKIFYEKLLMSPDTRRNLELMGHNLEPRDNLGRLMGIIIDTPNNLIIGASDSSSPNGRAVGY